MNYLLIHYGYFGLFLGLAGGIVGLPVPDEVLLTFVGYNITVGKMGVFPSMLAAFAGSIIGISLSYALGATLGLPFLHKYGSFFGITEKKIQSVHNLFERWGGLLLFFGYFIPGVRSVTAFIAAVSELKFAKFALYAYSGALVWVISFLLLGKELGREWHRILHFINNYRASVSLVLVALILFFIWRMVRVKTN